MTSMILARFGVRNGSGAAIAGSVRAFLIAAFLFFLTSMAPAGAQLSLPAGDAEGAATIEIPEDLTAEAIDAMVARMSDEQLRTVLLDQLHSQAAATDAEVAAPNFGEFFFHGTVGAFTTLLSGFANGAQAVVAQGHAFETFNDRFGASGWGRLLASLAIAVIVGLVAEWLANRVIQRWLPRQENVPDPTLVQTVSFLANRVVRDLMGIFVFYAAALIALNQVLEGELLPLAGTILFSLILLPRLVYSVARFLLAPHLAEYRMVHTDTKTAQFLTIHPVGLAIVGGLGAVIARFNFLAGIEMGSLGLAFWFDFLFRIYLAWIIWSCWDGIVTMMRGDESEVTPFEERVAKAYPAFAIGAVFVMWWLAATIVSYGAGQMLFGRPDILTLTLLLMAPAFDTFIRGLVHHLVPPMKGEGDIAAEAHATTKNSYKRIGRVAVFGLVLITIANAWGLSTEMLAGAGAAGRVVEAAFDVSAILILGYLSWELAVLLINRKLAAEKAGEGPADPAEMGGGEGGGAGSSRLSTVLPLLLACIKVAIIVLFTLVGLSELGIDTTPLLAGAGIAGLAIGFGAQKLVTDVVSGAFFLMDDAFRIDEYVEINPDTMGTVEKISIRSMRLRHHRGPVFTIPYGEIGSLKNFSRDWGIMKLAFTLPFDTDPEQVRKIFKQIGQDLLEHPEFGQDFLQPFKSQGVKEFNDVGMVIRGKFMAKPGKQWSMRKAIFTEVHKRLGEAGIPFARREVRVAMPDSENGEAANEEDKAKLAAAASSAVQDSMAPKT
ncbi:MAG: mechanosensitive ion channel family protein [Pseudomonadota bacterium]